MRIKKILRILLIAVATMIGLLILFVAVNIVPVDRKVDYRPLLDTMTHRIDAVDQDPVASSNTFSIGFAKINLTPSHPVAFAGYGKRIGKLYESVHDSIYVRSMVIDNGIERVAIVSADLLIIPPTVTALLEKELSSIGFTLDNTYLGATHTHNSIGNWGIGATSILYGSYDDSVVRFIADKIKLSIESATKNMLPSTLKAGSISIPEGVYNRVTDDGPVDPLLRVIEVNRSDSSKLLIMSYTAHPTCLFSRDLQLSGDYPGKLMNRIEQSGYTFSMFLAGAVGSHGSKVPEGGWSCVDWMADLIVTKFLEKRDQLNKVTDTSLEMRRVSLILNKAQPKFFHDWRFRPWLFTAAFGEYPTFISALKIGNVVMLSTPCDFSGEFSPSFDSLGAEAQVFPIITSFNGGYIGYVTPTKYYDVDHYETQLMNWYGPGNGEYIRECLEKLLLNVVD
ncbi:MAG TPA: neutral/alkaline non-lysosomal ceramidase N-terminal domain-containing protein [Chryseolinea sp.]|nr:neutral/alkaline non-lysosomal ceramidase N-terminal domain-containing protein [Chryseolinea sp.]